MNILFTCVFWVLSFVCLFMMIHTRKNTAKFIRSDSGDGSELKQGMVYREVYSVLCSLFLIPPLIGGGLVTVIAWLSIAWMLFHDFPNLVRHAMYPVDGYDYALKKIREERRSKDPLEENT